MCHQQLTEDNSHVVKVQRTTVGDKHACGGGERLLNVATTWRQLPSSLVLAGTLLFWAVSSMPVWAEKNAQPLRTAEAPSTTTAPSTSPATDQPASQAAPPATEQPTPPSLLPAMAGPLAVNPKRLSFDVGPIGKVYITGG